MYPQSRKNSAALLSILLASIPLAANAENGTGTNDWEYSASLYVWGAGIDAATASGADMDIDFTTLIENLNMTFMGSLEARKSSWSALADVVYLNVGSSESGSIPVSPGPGPGAEIDTDADVRMKGWVISLLGGYTVMETQTTRLDLIAGARYLDVQTEFDAEFRLGPITRPVSESAGGSVWDAVAGVRGRTELSENWYVPYHFDIGTGQSDLTWQAAAGVGYKLNWGDVSLVYRHMKWDFDNKDSLKDIRFSGPLLSATFHF